jgi:hypothetical protein
VGQRQINKTSKRKGDKEERKEARKREKKQMRKQTELPIHCFRFKGGRRMTLTTNQEALIPGPYTPSECGDTHRQVFVSFNLYR